MINPDKDLATIALMGAAILSARAETDSRSSNHLERVTADSLEYAANAIRKIVNENAELHDQLAGRKSSSYKTLDQLITDLIGAGCNPDFQYGERIRLKRHPDITGTVKGFWIALPMGKPLAVHYVLLDHSLWSIPIAAYCLEPLPGAGDQK